MPSNEIFLETFHMLLSRMILLVRYRIIPATVPANASQEIGHELDTLRPKDVLFIMGTFVIISK